MRACTCAEKVPLILIESTRRDRNAIRPKFSLHKCTVNRKNKGISSSSKKLYRIHPRRLAKEKTDEPLQTFQKSPIAACHVYASTGILKQESKFMNEIIKRKCDHEKEKERERKRE